MGQCPILKHRDAESQSFFKKGHDNTNILITSQVMMIRSARARQISGPVWARRRRMREFRHVGRQKFIEEVGGSFYLARLFWFLFGAMPKRNLGPGQRPDYNTGLLVTQSPQDLTT
ncbi:hypothetical protein DMA11_15925 [Marinilabiliaceae bacterium JC017]|nr:hypothetical protein DMA11_15925 [Marinilabiliaceae bacterium JC017]